MTARKGRSLARMPLEPIKPRAGLSWVFFNGTLGPGRGPDWRPFPLPSDLSRKCGTLSAVRKDRTVPQVQTIANRSFRWFGRYEMVKSLERNPSPHAAVHDLLRIFTTQFGGNTLVRGPDR